MIPPDTVTVREWDVSQLGDVEAKENSSVSYEDTLFINLKPGKVYELTANWDESKFGIHANTKQAEEALEITRGLLAGSGLSGTSCDSPATTDGSRPAAKSVFTRKEVADQLHVSIDTLRNWELNGLLKIIRSLRCADYSLASILRMLKAVSADPHANIRRAIDTPEQGDDIITACDKLLTSLREAKNNALFVAAQIEKMARMESSVVLIYGRSKPCQGTIFKTI